jgi:hypothetical protein
MCCWVVCIGISTCQSDNIIVDRPPVVKTFFVFFRGTVQQLRDFAHVFRSQVHVGIEGYVGGSVPRKFREFGERRPRFRTLADARLAEAVPVARHTGRLMRDSGRLHVPRQRGVVHPLDKHHVPVGRERPQSAEDHHGRIRERDRVAALGLVGRHHHQPPREVDVPPTLPTRLLLPEPGQVQQPVQILAREVRPLASPALRPPLPRRHAEPLDLIGRECCRSLGPPLPPGQPQPGEPIVLPHPSLYEVLPPLANVAQAVPRGLGAHPGRDGLGQVRQHVLGTHVLNGSPAAVPHHLGDGLGTPVRVLIAHAEPDP